MVRAVLPVTQGGKLRQDRPNPGAQRAQPPEGEQPPAIRQSLVVVQKVRVPLLTELTHQVQPSGWCALHSWQVA